MTRACFLIHLEVTWIPTRNAKKNVRNSAEFLCLKTTISLIWPCLEPVQADATITRGFWSFKMLSELPKRPAKKLSNRSSGQAPVCNRLSYSARLRIDYSKLSEKEIRSRDTILDPRMTQMTILWGQ